MAEQKTQKVKELIPKLSVLDVYKISCPECHWSRTATMFMAQKAFDKCPDCGNKNLMQTLMVNKDGKVKDAPTTPFKRIGREIAVEKVNDEELNDFISKHFSEGYKKEVGKMEKKKVVEKRKVCVNRNCGSYNVPKSLEHSKDGSAYGDVYCRFCGQVNQIFDKEK